MKIIKICVDKGLLLSYIDQQEHDFLINTHPKIPTFYTLPKIYKANCPGRPIIGSNNSVREPLSKFIDFFLKTFVFQIPSFVFDTKNFINKAEGLEIPK